MARRHLYIRDDLCHQLNELVTEGQSFSKLVTQAIEFFLASGQPPKEDTTAGSDEIKFIEPTERLDLMTVTDLRESQHRPPSELGLLPIETIKRMRRGSVVWFSLGDICDALDVRPNWITEVIDPEDDILRYAGEEWVIDRGIEEARNHCIDPDLVSKFDTWISTV